MQSNRYPQKLKQCLILLLSPAILLLLGWIDLNHLDPPQLLHIHGLARHRRLILLLHKPILSLSRNRITRRTNCLSIYCRGTLRNTTWMNTWMFGLLGFCFLRFLCFFFLILPTIFFIIDRWSSYHFSTTSTQFFVITQRSFLFNLLSWYFLLLCNKFLIRWSFLQILLRLFNFLALSLFLLFS